MRGYLKDGSSDPKEWPRVLEPKEAAAMQAFDEARLRMKEARLREEALLSIIKEKSLLEGVAEDKKARSLLAEGEAEDEKARSLLAEEEAEEKAREKRGSASRTPSNRVPTCPSSSLCTTSSPPPGDLRKG